MKPIKIAITEDHQMVIDGLTSIIEMEDDLEVIFTANNGQQLLDQMEIQLPDVILMDVNMPVMDGMETTKKVSEKYPKIPVLMLTMHDDLRIVKETLKIGAKGFVIKNTSATELINGIKEVHIGNTFYSKSISKKMMDEMFGHAEKSNQKNDIAVMPSSLTKRETEILKLICQEYTSSEMSEQLFISTNTVETHRKNLLRKVGVKNTAGLVKYALKNKITS